MSSSASGLTPQQERIAALVAKGKNNREIAAALGLSEGTVKEYLNRAFALLGIGNRTALAVWWERREHDRISKSEVPA